MPLNGKHALITGSSRGIGRGIALKLAASGVKVAVHYYQNEAAARETLGQVRKNGADGFVVQAKFPRGDEVVCREAWETVSVARSRHEQVRIRLALEDAGKAFDLAPLEHAHADGTLRQ